MSEAQLALSDAHKKASLARKAVTDAASEEEMSGLKLPKMASAGAGCSTTPDTHHFGDANKRQKIADADEEAAATMLD